MSVEQGQGYQYVEVGVDWVTITLQAERPGYRDWAVDAGKWVRDGVQRGDIEKAMSINGYRGFMVGSRFIGSRDYDTMLRVSGGSATEGLWEYWRNDANITRLDLQATVWPLRHTPGYIVKRAYAMTKEKWTASKAKVGQPRFLMDHRSGATVMIGSPKSRFMLRLYDKGVESQQEHYKGAVRYELQMRDELSRMVAKNLIERGQRGLQMAVRDTVLRECRQRGIEPLEGAVDEYAVASSLKRETPDVERKLNWLTAQVAPTLRFMASKGKLPEALLALGLWQYTDEQLQDAIDTLRQIE